MSIDVAATSTTPVRPSPSRSTGPSDSTPSTWSTSSRCATSCARSRTTTRVRAVVLTGAGRGFCAGGDVTSMTGEGGNSAEPVGAEPAEPAEPVDLRAIMEVSELLHGMPALTVAAVNGPCAGAGLSFACACDLRYAARSAVFVERVPARRQLRRPRQRLGAHPRRRTGQGARAAAPGRADRRGGGTPRRPGQRGRRRRRAPRPRRRDRGDARGHATQRGAAR